MNLNRNGFALGWFGVGSGWVDEGVKGKLSKKHTHNNAQITFCFLSPVFISFSIQNIKSFHFKMYAYILGGI